VSSRGLWPSLRDPGSPFGSSSIGSTVRDVRFSPVRLTCGDSLVQPANHDPLGDQMIDYIRIRLQGMAKTERGATAVEYGLLVALIAAVIVATVAILGGRIHDAFTTVNDELAP
jgi:pilus assembly protein Flp/PilA